MRYRLKYYHHRRLAGRQHAYYRVYRSGVPLGQIVVTGDGVGPAWWYVPGLPDTYEGNGAAIDALEASRRRLVLVAS